MPASTSTASSRFFCEIYNDWSAYPPVRMTAFQKKSASTPCAAKLDLAEECQVKRKSLSVS
eukprot:scaffold12578_cov30-Tisochrysis_lutea.AAC.2